MIEITKMHDGSGSFARPLLVFAACVLGRIPSLDGKKGNLGRPPHCAVHRAESVPAVRSRSSAAAIHRRAAQSGSPLGPVLALAVADPSTPHVGSAADSRGRRDLRYDADAPVFAAFWSLDCDASGPDGKLVQSWRPTTELRDRRVQ